MEKVPKLKLQVLKVRNIVLILSKLVNEINVIILFSATTILSAVFQPIK